MRGNGHETDDGERGRFDRALPALTLVAMATVLVALTILIGPVDVTRPDWLESEGGGGGPTDPAVTLTWAPSVPLATAEPATGSGLDFPFAEVFLGLALVVAAGIAYMLYRKVRLTRRSRASRVTGGEVEIDETVDDLRRAAEEAGDALRDDNVEASDAIIRAWLALERTAADSGAARGAAQTPSEFTADLLRRYRADADAVRRLLDLYEQARFSTDPEMSAHDVATAQRALDDITRTLSAHDAEEHA